MQKLDTCLCSHIHGMIAKTRRLRNKTFFSGRNNQPSKNRHWTQTKSKWYGRRQQQDTTTKQLSLGTYIWHRWAKAKDDIWQSGQIKRHTGTPEMKKVWILLRPRFGFSEISKKSVTCNKQHFQKRLKYLHYYRRNYMK